ncbi:peptidase [Haematobacter missouriensis]|uniref:Peptidase n=1 Tax=Haematobacter missouriensis TaxID=366616 RepID=A0A212AL38_9RHOB|nr:dipeptidase [Haematobacter missouriensis]KFI29504.1 peptidase [Haematobacter missouriensis]OWJ80095.1 peptidase [Haematobacter missouriensis]OWJ82133.1 peptidase [Haematobacter missouriensis]
MSQPVFDGHNDFLLRLYRAPERREQIWLKGEGRGHLDLPRMKQAGFAGGFFAIWIPTPHEGGGDVDALMDNPPYSIGLPGMVSTTTAQHVAITEASLLLWMERSSGGSFRVCRTVEEIRATMQAGGIAAIMHMEGAEAISESLDELDLYYEMGLRSLGPVWSRPTIFGHGVPFRFPSSPDTGPGLTEAGKRLVRRCNALRIMIDLSHLNEAGFNDVAALSDAPLVATHSNAHAVTPSARNLTDRQLAIIAESDGMVGLNYATSFLRPDGRRGSDIGWEPVLAHLDHLIGKLGETRVGLGSDFDGATVPDEIGDVTGMLALQDAMAAHGYDAPLIAKLCHENWLRVLEKTWGG